MRIKIARLFRRVAPFLVVLAALTLIVLVLISMQLTSLDWQWIAFFAGVLGTAIVTMGSRSMRSERSLARRRTPFGEHSQPKMARTPRQCLSLILGSSMPNECTRNTR